MTYEEAIEQLGNYGLEDIDYTPRSLREAVAVAKKAISKQIPAKVIRWDKNDRECFCPSCMCYVGWYDAGAKDISRFCGKCGQAVFVDKEDT